MIQPNENATGQDVFRPADERLYEYAVIRFVPDVEREEFINVGLVMMCKRRRQLCGAIVLDEAKARQLDPEADLERLRLQLSLFERTDIPSADLPVEERYRWLTATKSAIIQMSPSHPGLMLPGETFEQAFERLLTSLVK